MREQMKAGLVKVLLAGLVGCGEPSVVSDARSPSTSKGEARADATAEARMDEQTPPSAGPAAKAGGGLRAEPEGVEARVAIEIRWSATIVTGIPEEGVTTTVYQRTAHLDCPITSGAEASSSYFAAYDNPNGDVLAATGSYQPWWNEDCTGSLTVNDTYHFNDPTTAGPEPVIPTTGTRPLSTADTPLTIETDLNRARTRYMFVTPSTDGFVQAAARGDAAKVVSASAAPMATMDFTLEGPIGDGKREIAVQGGKVWIEWVFTRGRNPR
jgi:hypothetical protein